MEARPQQAQALRRQIECTLARAVDPTDVLPLLHRLARVADEGTDDSVFAHLHLAGLLVEKDPWRAALCARRVLRHRPEDHRGWATLALCQTLSGNYRYAVSAYHRALAAAPNNPWYAHNLGHLLDVALDRGDDAVAWLKRAHQGAASSSEVAASYAHALARVGRVSEARRILVRAMRRGASREQTALLKWIERGAPLDMDHPLPRPAPVHAIGVLPTVEERRKSRRTASTSSALAARRTGGAIAQVPLAEFEAELSGGLINLPLDARQRERALSLARDAGAHFLRQARDAGKSRIKALAAAVAYAIVYVDHVPLSQAEVAACFRVGVANLRGRFTELRSHLDLTPGDARYATFRR
jgi:tetratricopeptide (TPR) repeat protein